MTKGGSKKMRAYVLIETAPGKTKAVKKELAAIHGNDSTVANLDAVTGPFDAGGTDWVFDCVGAPVTIRQGIDMLDWGGTCTLLGVPKLGTEASFVVNSMYNDKSILGCRYGSTRPHHDIPLLVRFYQDGRLQLAG